MTGQIGWPACSEHGAMYVVGPMLEYDAYRRTVLAFQCCKCGARVQVPAPDLPEQRRRYVVAVLPDGSWIEDGPGGRQRVSLEQGEAHQAIAPNKGVEAPRFTNLRESANNAKP